MSANYHYSGIIHVHSNYSDGTRSIPDIARIANELDFDFLLLTDHNTLQPKFDGLEGWYKNVLVGIGCELNDREDLNHYLAFDLDEEISHLLPPEEYVCRVREKGGFGIVAHPDESRHHISKYRAYPWTLWDSDCYDGIEIWNQMSEWMEGLTHFNKFYRILHPRRSIIAPKPETLARWDKINMKRKVVGIGGVDAHEHVYRFLKFFWLRIFHYKVSFRTIRTHVLLDQPLSDKTDYKQDLQKIYRAIRAGHCYVAHNYFGNASDYMFRAETDLDGQTIMGGELEFDKEACLLVKNPVWAETLLVHNGSILSRQEGKDLRFPTSSSGIYRAETHVDGRPWIFSNHIRLIRKDRT